MAVSPIVAAFTSRRGVIVEPGWGTGNVVLKLGAKIFAIVGEDRLVVKLPKARVDELVEAKAGKRFDPRKNGRVMKEWLVAGARADKLALANEAFEFAKGLRTQAQASRRSRSTRTASIRTRAARSRP